MSERSLKFLFLLIFGVFESIRVTIIPVFSDQLMNLGFLALSLKQYSLLFLVFSLAAFFSTLLAWRVIEKKGLFKTFLLIIFFDLLSMYFTGMMLLAFSYEKLAIILLLLTLIFSGASFGLLIPTATTLIGEIFPKKTEIFFLLFFFSLSLGSLILFTLSKPIVNHSALFLPGFFLAFIFLFLLLNYFHVFAHSYEHVAIERKNLVWPLITSMFAIGVLETIFFDWILLFTEKIGFNESQANKIYLAFLLFFAVSQLLVAALLLKIEIKRLYLLLPFILFMVSGFALFYFGKNSAMLFFSLLAFFHASNWPLIMAWGRKKFGNSPQLYGLLVAGYEIGFGIASLGFTMIHKVTLFNSLVFFSLIALCSLLIFLCNLLSTRKEVKT